MAEIKKIKISGTSYDIKDEVARNGLSGKADSTHSHTEYASSTHTHSEYQTASDVSSAISTAISGIETSNGNYTLSATNEILTFTSSNSTSISYSNETLFL